MNILWIVNTIFPAPSKYLGLSKPVVGGWMYDSALHLSKDKRIKLAVASIYSGKLLKKITLGEITYYLIPSKSSQLSEKNFRLLWEEIYNEFFPDIVHIHGTEYSHGLSCMNQLPDLKYVISIQGLLSECSKFYFAGISSWDIFKNITLRDLIRNKTIFQERDSFRKRGIIEKEYLVRTCEVIGRTNWDFTHVKGINSKINYHFCNESLRNSFYLAPKWSIEKCKRYSVFLSQGDYPIKGLHQLIKSLSYLKDDYPDLVVRVAGFNITKRESFKEKLKFSGYAKYLVSLIKKYKLERNIEFIGRKSEQEMVFEYKCAHVFICPSSIENSPNSLGEAQLIGVPVIGAYVGGIPDMIEHGKTGLLYRFEDVAMLAQNIRNIFEDSILSANLSENEIIVATKRHDREVNLLNTIAIYNSING